VSPEVIVAFISGIAAVLSSAWGLRSLHRRDRRECDERVDEVMRTYKEGLREKQ